jgi:arginine-tRNA-protein transferase
MTFARRLRPTDFDLPDWDNAWAHGWFRMRQSLFTTHFLAFDRQLYPAIWLRVGLRNLPPDRLFLNLKKRNARFRAEVVPLDRSGPSADEESLYARYRASLAFEPAPSLRDLLWGEDSDSRFPTYQIRLFDGETLIAGGIFDRGDRAAAGISCYYDPAYRKHSLGKYLIYLKMDHCQREGLDWFYPGYAAPGQPRFDYKWDLGPATLEYLSLATGNWEPWSPSSSVPHPLDEMTARLVTLAGLASERQPVPRLRRYLHVDINLNPQVQGLGLFDFPVFLDVFPGLAPAPVVVVVADPRDGQYHLLHLRSVYRFPDLEDEEGLFASNLLAVQRLLFSTEDAAEAALVLDRLTVS